MNPIFDPFFFLGLILIVVSIMVRVQADKCRSTKDWMKMINISVITGIASLASLIAAIVRAVS